jgi:hypothetical protein
MFLHAHDEDDDEDDGRYARMAALGLIVFTLGGVMGLVIGIIIGTSI